MIHEHEGDGRMELKRIAGERAVECIENNMVIGLGTGSTVYYSIVKIGELVENGWDLVGVPTSRSTVEIATKHGIPLGTLETYPRLDVTIDGADEVDPELDLIKGLGGALVREKIVASCTQRQIIVVDGSKMVDCLGTRSPLPVEVTPFGHRASQRALEALGCTVEIRRDEDGDGDGLFRSDNGNYILDCGFERITDPRRLSASIDAIPGVVTSGLFLGLTDDVIVASEEGVRHLRRSE